MSNKFHRRGAARAVPKLLLLLIALAAAYIQWSRSNSEPAPNQPKPTAKQQDAEAGGERLRGHVSFIPDGDTLVVRVGEQETRVRLWGIDSPEGNTKQPYASQARDYARKLASGKRVELLVKDHDQYGRTVAEAILPDGKNLNQEMVAAGYAWHYKSHAKNEKTLARLEDEARRAHRGLWADAHPTPPWQWRKEHAKP